MVSLLVETGFISNPEEEEKLTNKQHQRDLARAIFEGVLRYNQRYPVPGSYFAWQADQRNAPATVAATRSERKPAPEAAPPTAPPTPATNSAPADNKVIRYRIAPGDNLTRIADRHQVSLAELRTLNNLTDDTVKIGQTLKIPVN